MTRPDPAYLPAGAIAITGLGLTTSLGLDVVASCASARAGVTQWTQLDIEEPDLDTLESVPLKGHAVRGLTDGFDGIARLLRLGDAALADLLVYSGLGETAYQRTGFHLCLPGHFHSTFRLETELLGQGPAPDDVAREEFRMHFEQRQALQAKLEGRMAPSWLSMQGLSIAPKLRTCFYGGPAVFAQAVELAVRRLRARELDRCIVGGIDTCVSGAPLMDAYQLGLLRTEEKPTGFFPGEAASFVLFERADAVRERGGRAEALLSAVAMAEEPYNRFSGVPSQGSVLTAITEACLRERKAHPGLLIVNLNGDEFRAREFGTALVRLRGSVLSESPRQWFPPESFGEIGTATGAASVCLSVRGFSRGYAGSSSALVLLLGDDEARGAVLVDDIPAHPARSGIP